MQPNRCFAGGPSTIPTKDSSDERGAHLESPPRPQPPPVIALQTSATIATQTVATWEDHIQALGELSSCTLVMMNPIKDQFWHHFLSCVKMPAGGVNGTGSQKCGFEFVAANEKVVQFLMEDLPCMANHRYNLTIAAPYWEKSPTISTYHALDLHTIDSYCRFHLRKAARRSRGYRGSALAAPPDDHPLPVCLLSVCPPFLVELCQRKHSKLVLAMSFNLSIHNDKNLQSLPSKMPYALGMDNLLRHRTYNHLKKLLAKKVPMSSGLAALATSWSLQLSDSEGEWVAPPSDLSILGLPPRAATDPELDSGDEADTEAEAYRQRADTKRPRATGTRWEGKFRER